MRLIPLNVYGDLVIYERVRGRETWVPKYVVMRHGRVLEEFRRYASAQRWATGELLNRGGDQA